MVMYTLVQSSDAYTYTYYWGCEHSGPTRTNSGQDFRVLNSEYQNDFNIFGATETARRNMYAKIFNNTFYWYSNYSSKEDGPSRQFNIKNCIYYWIAF